ncbi:hypothetical protein V2J09_017847 [Rumex salicifolius]
MAVKPIPATAAANANPSRFTSKLKLIPRTRFLYPGVRASQSMDDKSKVFKELGLFALRKKIEDAVHRAEALAPSAIELEEAQRIRREEVVRGCHLWDDPVKSNEVLLDLAHSAKVVDSLKDLKYKAEEAKLIAQLVETDAVNHRLFRQAYSDSVDLSKFLDQYEMSKILKGPFDKQGASLVIKAQPQDSSSEPIVASVDVVPLFLESFPDLAVDEEDIRISSETTSRSHEHGRAEACVSVQHLPTGISVQSCGERSRFANKMKAVNRLKARLLVIVQEQGVCSLQSVKRDAIFEAWKKETRRYTLYPSKLVLDLKTGFQLADLNSVLDGNIQLLIAAHATMRHSNYD